MNKILTNQKSRMFCFIGVLVLIFIAGLIASRNDIASAAANTWYVAASGDDLGPCNSPDQPCATLQAAVDKASPGDSLLATGETFRDGFSISSDLNVSGGWDQTFSTQTEMTTIDQAFDYNKKGIIINEGATVQVEYFSVENGSSNVFGAGVHNGGNLMLSHCIVRNNKGFHGSGVFNSGKMTISSCSIDHNFDAYNGGGVYNQGDLTILDSSIDHNSSSNAGGIYNGYDYAPSWLVIKNSSIWANTAGMGGGLENLSNAELVNTTIAENTANYAGIYHSGGTTIINNCTIVRNQGYGLVANGGDDVHLRNSIMMMNSVADALNMPFLDGYNMVGTILYLEGGYLGPGNMIGVQPAIVGGLEGWPAYAPLPPTSLSIDRGDPSGCFDSHGNLLDQDTRGLPRFGRCDVGAYEIQAIEYSTMTADNYQPHTGMEVTFEIDLNNMGTEIITKALVSNALPVSFAYITDTLKSSAGEATYNDGTISWEGSVDAKKSVTIEYGVNVGAVTGDITSTAVITTTQEVFNRSARVWVVDKYYSYSPCTTRACLPTYSDDFSDSNSGWPNVYENDYAMSYQNGEYFISANQNWIAWALRDFGYSDFQISIDARTDTFATGSVAIMFSATDSGFYTFEIYDGWFSVWRNDADSWTWTPLINWTESAAIHPGKSTNNMKVIRAGSNIRVYANGQLLGTVEDGTYRGTASGLAVEAYTGYFIARYDNFVMFTEPCIGTTLGNGVMPYPAFTARAVQMNEGDKILPIFRR